MEKEIKEVYSESLICDEDGNRLCIRLCDFVNGYPNFSITFQDENKNISKRFRVSAVMPELNSKVVGDYKLYYAPTNVNGFYDIGSVQLKDNCDHKAGYVWSSRPSVINEYFGTRLIYCYVNNCVASIDYDLLEIFIKKANACPNNNVKYKIVKEKKDSGEINYKAVRIRITE